MDNWEKIINGYREKAIAKDQSTMKLIEATVLGASADYKRAKVQLITGQVIDNLINQSGNKIYVGQWVKVGYLTYPSKGWIAFTNGEADPIHEGGGVEVETAAVLDADNVHRWLAEEELMMDINPQTKLLYGGHHRLVAIQGYCCRFGSSVTLTEADAPMFGTEMNVELWWRSASGSGYTKENVKIELVVNALTRDSNTEKYRYTFGVIFRGSDWVQTFTTVAVTEPSDAFLVPTVSSLSFATEYSTTWSGIKETVQTPYGYAQNRNVTIQVGVIDGDGLRILPLRTKSSQVTVYIGGTGTPNTYSCMPLETAAEKYFDLAITKRSEPTGGDNSGT